MKHRGRLTVFLFIVALVNFAGCKQRHPNGSSVSMHGGTRANGSYRAVVEVGGGCTGTFVGGSILLTAAHCVNDLYDTTSCGTTVEGRTPIRCEVPDGYIRNSVYVSNDIAVMAFKPSDYRAIAGTYINISDVRPMRGDGVTFVGFGQPNPGVKYYGHNTISRVSYDGLISFGHNGARADHGDSGGPLLNSDGRMIGITHAKGGFGQSFFVYLGSTAAVKTMESVINWSLKHNMPNRTTPRSDPTPRRDPPPRRSYPSSLGKIADGSITSSSPTFHGSLTIASGGTYRLSTKGFTSTKIWVSGVSGAKHETADLINDAIVGYFSSGTYNYSVSHSTPGGGGDFEVHLARE